MNCSQITGFTADSAHSSLLVEFSMSIPLQIVEPTLQDQSGHCHSFVASLCSAGQGYPLRLWVARNARLPDLEGAAVIERYFQRRLRKFQALLLYRYLLRQPGKIFVSTAGRLDVMLLSWAAQKVIPPGKVCLYFHWVRPSAGKQRFFSKIAKKQPHIRFMTPTESFADFFRGCGISSVTVVPYPVSAAPSRQESVHSDFRHLLYAGAARQDKGFGAAVDLVEYLAESLAEIPVTMQISSEHYGKLEDQVCIDIERLRKVSYQLLKLCPETLTSDEYLALFAGAICLQLYNQRDFADRISGVTLDAMAAGAPVVTLADTWISRVVLRFGAGIVIDNASPATITAAVQRITAAYADYRDKARHAGQVISAEHDSAILFRELTSV